MGLRKGKGKTDTPVGKKRGRERYSSSLRGRGRLRVYSGPFVLRVVLMARN